MKLALSMEKNLGLKTQVAHEIGTFMFLGFNVSDGTWDWHLTSFWAQSFKWHMELALSRFLGSMFQMAQEIGT